MKRIYFLLLSLFSIFNANSRYVEFSVNMNNEVASVNGIHVTGDFQIAAGFTGGNWNPASTVLTQIGALGIYSVVVNIPAKKKYEYKYVNGDQFYESEYVPDESRVGYLFNDNRWFYLDSLQNDTLKLPCLIFSTNAPLSKKLLRFRVGISGIILNSAGVHVAGTFNNFNTVENYMYSFDGKIFEYITYLDTLTTSTQFRYINGNNTAQYETVPAACNVQSNREAIFSKDTVMPLVCLGSCVACPSGISKYELSNNIKVFPNPFKQECQVFFGDNNIRDLLIIDSQGRVVRKYAQIKHHLIINSENMSIGIYYITTSRTEKIKLIIIQ